jgi:hypothetical protein
MSRRWFAAIYSSLLALTLLQNVYLLYRCGNGLFPIDAFSEAVALRSGEKYAREGFFAACGLPDVSYGDHYSWTGHTKTTGRTAEDTTYHGYPPGANWLTGISTILFGEGHIARYRIVPVAFGLLASAVFLTSLTRTLGAWRGLFVYLACILAPMFTNLTHNLYFMGYALSLLLLEMSALMRVLRRPGPSGAGCLVILFLLTFLQGWFSFEYAFLTTLVALPLALLIAAPRHGSLDWRKVGTLIVVCGGGFVFAHGLHFLQSVAYFGDFREAIEEYTYRAQKGYGPGETFRGQPRWLVILSGIGLYATAYLRYTQLCSPISILLSGATLAAVFLSRASCTIGRGLRLRACFSARPRMLAGVVSALIISLLWLFAKPYHAINHIPQTGRHLFLFYFSCCVLIAQATSMRIDWKRRGRMHRWSGRAAVEELDDVAGVTEAAG